MIKRIPKEIRDLYREANWRNKLYLELRWRLCPFEKIEEYLPKRGKILDLGCGYGILANYLILKSKEREVVGIDFSPKRISVAKLSAGRRKNIQFLKKDVKDIVSQSCQGVVMSDFLHHISPKTSRELLKIVYQKIRPGGRLVIQDVDNTPRWKLFCSTLSDGILYPGKPIYFRPFSEWKKMLEEMGFKVAVVPAHEDLFLADALLICDK